MHPLQIAAEQAGRPYVSVLLSHAAIPSAFNHPLGIPLGRLGNRALWWLTRTLLHRAAGHYPNRLRKRLGMRPTEDIVTEAWLSPHLTLASFLAAGAKPVDMTFGSWMPHDLASQSETLRLLTPSWRRRNEAVGHARRQAIRCGGTHQRAGALGAEIAAHGCGRPGNQTAQPDSQAAGRPAQACAGLAGNDDQGGSHFQGDGARGRGCASRRIYQ